MLADVPGVWLGRELTFGVYGFHVRGLMWLQPTPPGRTLLTNRLSPPALCRIVQRHDGGCDLRLWIYPFGFPWFAATDPIAVAFFDDWLTGVASALDATAPSAE
jgi:hypothetical protein